jgi:outer membrane biosynthesis protein TonB
MTEHPTHDPEREQPQDQPQVPPQPEQPPQPPQPETSTAARQPDGSWTLTLRGDRDDMRSDLRSLTRAIAAALRTDGNGGESCPDQIGATVGQWAAEAIYA